MSPGFTRDVWNPAKNGRIYLSTSGGFLNHQQHCGASLYITHPHNAWIFNGNPSKLPSMCILWSPPMGHLMIPWTNRPRFFDGQIGQTWDDLEMLLLLSLRITWNNELVGWLSHRIEKHMRKLNFNYGTPKSLSKNEPSLNATQLSSDVLLGLPSRFNLPSFMKQSNLDVILGSWHYFKASNAAWKMMKPSLIGSWHCSLSPNLRNLDILGGSWAKNHRNASLLMQPTVGHGVSTASVLKSVIRTHWKPMRKNIRQYGSSTQVGLSIFKLLKTNHNLIRQTHGPINQPAKSILMIGFWCLHLQCGIDHPESVPKICWNTKGPK